MIRRSLLLALVALPLALAGMPATTARAAPQAADTDEAATPAAPDADAPRAGPVAQSPADWSRDAPAAVDSPQLRNVEPHTRLYLDGTFAQSPDLSALPYVQGSGRNIRFALGGSLKLRRFQLDTELPASQITTLDLTQIPGGAPIPQDQHQTALSIGDLRLGAQWTTPFQAETLRGAVGFGFRLRVPTHTTRFQFHFGPNGDMLGVYSFPYYFHLEPTVLFGEAWGPVSLVVNQGAILLTGPDGNFQEVHIVVPNIYFWDAHYALALRLIEGLVASVELDTVYQLNHVSGADFSKLNDIRAVTVSPGLQVHLGAYRVDAVARFGLTHGEELFGVIGYAGSRSYTLRVTRFFD